VATQAASQHVLPPHSFLFIFLIFRPFSFLVFGWDWRREKPTREKKSAESRKNPEKIGKIPGNFAEKT